MVPDGFLVVPGGFLMVPDMLLMVPDGFLMVPDMVLIHGVWQLVWVGLGCGCDKVSPQEEEQQESNEHQ